MKYRTYVLTILIVCLLLTISIQPHAADYENNIHIVILDESCSCYYLESDVLPVLKEGSTLAPLREMAEAFDFDVAWDDTDQSVTIFKGDKMVKLKIGEKDAVLNGEVIELPVAPEIFNHKTMVPVRSVSELMGIYVNWRVGIENQSFVWLSPFALLSDEDTSPGDAYYKTDEDIPYFTLKNDGVTARGIKIGDEYEKVAEQYGRPHKTGSNNEQEYLYYYTPSLPNTDDGHMLIFAIENGRVASVEIDF